MCAFIFKDSENTIIKIINEAFIRKFTKDFYKQQNIDLIEDIVRQVVRQTIVQSHVWQALVNGGPQGLDAHFGIPRDTLHSRLNTILDIWSNEIVVEPQRIKRRPRTTVFSYRFYAIKADWANVLSSPAGITINESRRAKKGETPREIPWLEWLLITGDQLEIEGYHIDYGDYSRSRSGKAYMRPKLSWRIPSEFGPFSKDNNFVTKALENLAKSRDFRNKMTGVFEDISGKMSQNFEGFDFSPEDF